MGTFGVDLRISNKFEHQLILGRSTVADSNFALARPVQSSKAAAFPLIDIRECWHSASASEFCAAHQTVIGYSRRHNNLLRIGGAYFSIFVVKNLEIRPEISDRTLSMRHQLYTQPHEFFNKIEGLPSSILLFHGFVVLIVFESKKMFFASYEGKGFDVVIYFFPHSFGVDSELEEATIFETDE
jgi:hypothetical protein